MQYAPVVDLPADGASATLRPGFIARMNAAVDLSVHVAGLKLSNPILAASGTFAYGVEFAHLADLNRLGGIVGKGLSAKPIEGAPAPRLCETPAGMLNAVGLQNIGAERFLTDKLPELRKYRTAILVNIFGMTTAEYVAATEILERGDGIAGYELNVSCPNTERGGVQVGADPELLREVVTAVRRVAKRPLIVKLSPNVTDITALARVAENAGADAISLINTITGMAVDVETREPRLGNVTGGLSGPAIKPIALRMVYQVCRAVKIPVIGLGGIVKAEDVAEFLIVGAQGVQVGTAHFLDPAASVKLVGEFEKWCQKKGVRKMSDLIGTLRVDRHLQEA